MKLLAVLMLVIAGCGPSAEERYNTSLSILKAEREELARLQPAYDAAGASIILKVCQESTGSPLPRDLGPPPDEIGANIDKSDPDAAQKAIDTLLEAQKKISEQTARLNEASQLVMQPGSPENKRMLNMISQTPEYQAYSRQQDRVARAEKAVADAEAALPSAGSR